MHGISTSTDVIKICVIMRQRMFAQNRTDKNMTLDNDSKFKTILMKSRIIST